ncbi:MAG: SCO family protein [Alphaproteobacteria bacterium]|nr:SCO family protein [Alphaproteobacteria bacterium]
MKKRILRTLLFSAVALAIGVGVAWVQVGMKSARTVQKGASTEAPIAGLNIGGPFTLTDHEGTEVTEKTYDGQYKLIYFGFTYCPAICPTELQKMSRVMNALEDNYPEAAQNIQPLFVTIDPERDTVPVMQEYVSLFHPRLIGLTGTVPQINIVKKNYRIYASKVETEEQNDYTMDHSSFIYLMGPDNTLLGMYRTSDTPDGMYQDIVKLMKLS